MQIAGTGDHLLADVRQIPTGREIVLLIPTENVIPMVPAKIMLPPEGGDKTVGIKNEADG